MAKKFTKPSINWVELEKRVHPQQKPNFLAFKAKSDVYLRRMESYPAEPPKIDWEAYQKIVPVSGLVEKFKSSYEELKIPYPTDTLSSKVDEQWKSIEPEIKSYCAERQKDADNAKKELDRLNAMPKLEEITLEMYYDMFPKEAFDPVNRPTFWPHNPEEQLDYKPPEPKSKEVKAETEEKTLKEEKKPKVDKTPKVEKTPKAETTPKGEKKK